MDRQCVVHGSRSTRDDPPETQHESVFVEGEVLVDSSYAVLAQPDSPISRPHDSPASQSHASDFDLSLRLHRGDISGQAEKAPRQGGNSGTRDRGDAEKLRREDAGSLTRVEDLEETGQRIDRELLSICRASQSCGLGHSPIRIRTAGSRRIVRSCARALVRSSPTRVFDWTREAHGSATRYGGLRWSRSRSLVGSYHSRYEPLMNRTVRADLPTPPEPITAHCGSAGGTSGVHVLGCRRSLIV